MIKNKSLLELKFVISVICLTVIVFVQVCYGEDKDYCIECHSEIDEELVLAFQDDAHSLVGLQCSSCHGGDPTIDDDDAMSAKNGFTGVPERINEPDFCGKCHSDPSFMRSYNPSIPTDQVDKYWTSQHGTLLKKNDQKVATCSSCHNAHGILPPNTPKSTVYPLNIPSTCANCHSKSEYMADYGIPTNQYEHYADSSNVHGFALFVKRDISAPVCNDCHGNHGAAPPKIEDVGQVCTQCHSLNGKLFRSSPHKEVFDAFEISECAFCHQASPDIDEPHKNIHKIVKADHKLIGTGQGALCGQCHTAGDNGWEAAALISTWRDSLESRLHGAETLLETVEERGFEISDARWMLNGEVHQAMMELRTILHAFDLESYKPIFVKADSILGEVLIAGRDAAEEVHGRRLYFIIISILIIMLIITVVLKIRDMEQD